MQNDKSRISVTWLPLEWAATLQTQSITGTDISTGTIRWCTTDSVMKLWPEGPIRDWCERFLRNRAGWCTTETLEQITRKSSKAWCATFLQAKKDEALLRVVNGGQDWTGTVPVAKVSATGDKAPCRLFVGEYCSGVVIGTHFVLASNASCSGYCLAKSGCTHYSYTTEHKICLLFDTCHAGIPAPQGTMSFSMAPCQEFAVDNNENENLDNKQVKTTQEEQESAVDNNETDNLDNKQAKKTQEQQEAAVDNNEFENLDIRQVKTTQEKQESAVVMEAVGVDSTFY